MIVGTVEVPDRLPEHDAGITDDGEEGAEDEARADLALHDLPPVAEADFADGHGADDQGRGLGAGVAAAADDERDEEGEDDGAGDLFFEVAHGAGGEHFADEEDAKPAATLLHHAPEAGLEVGGVERGHAADLLNVLAGFFGDDVDDVIDGDDAFHAAFGVDDGDGEEVMGGEEFGDGFLVHLFGGLDDLGAHEVADEAVPIGCEEVAEGGDAEEALVFVEDVAVVDGFEVGGLAAEVTDGFVGSHFGTEAGEAGGHEAAGGVLFIGEEGGDFASGGFVEEAEEVGPAFFGGELDEVGGVVGGELADPEAVDAVGEVLEEVGLLAAVEFEEELFGAFGGEGLEGVEALFRGEAGPLFEEGFEAEFGHRRVARAAKSRLLHCSVWGWEGVDSGGGAGLDGPARRWRWGYFGLADDGCGFIWLEYSVP